MRLGLVSDIHADHRALLRALAVLEEHGADRVVCLGDLVEKGPDGDRVVATLNEHLVACVRGNHDDNAVRRRLDGDADDGDPLVDADTASWLAALPRERHEVWSGVRVAMSHIAPCGIEESVLPEHVPKSLKRSLRGFEADVLLLGHTHRPMKIRHGDLWIINPGSVAGTRTRDSFTCAVLELPSLTLTVLSLDDGAPAPFAEGLERAVPCPPACFRGEPGCRRSPLHEAGEGPGVRPARKLERGQG